MIHRIALLADIHGNATALKAVIEDSVSQGATEYWILGDLIMPGPGTDDIFDILSQIPVTLFLRGNWEDCLLEALADKNDLTNPGELYVSRLAQYVYPRLNRDRIDMIKSWPIQATIEINHLKIGVTHNLPDKNYGRDLSTLQKHIDYDLLFKGRPIDLAVFAHTHHPILNYNNSDQPFINPGSVGQAFSTHPALSTDFRAQYAVLEIDEEGLSQIHFRRVHYDRQAELALAHEKCLPYLELYSELLLCGNIYTHDHEVLDKINKANHYYDDVNKFLRAMIR